MEVFVHLSPLQNEEMEYRRFLFKVAADGDVRAQKALEREYRLRVRPKNNSRTKHSRPTTKKVGANAE